MNLPVGTRPERELLRIFRVWSLGALANVTGIGPKKLLKLRSNRANVPTSPKLAGIALFN